MRYYSQAQLGQMSPAQLLDAIEQVNAEILQLATAPRKIGKWDKFVWAGGLTLGIAGVAVGGALSLPALLVAAGGFGLIGADILKKLGDIRGDAELQAEIDALTVTRAALIREYQSRP